MEYLQVGRAKREKIKMLDYHYVLLIVSVSKRTTRLRLPGTHTLLSKAHLAGGRQMPLGIVSLRGSRGRF